MESEAESERVVTVNIYDTHASNANFKVKPTTTAAEICKIILSKRDILSSESKYFSIVIVVTAFNAAKKIETHCLRTLKPNETLVEVHKAIVAKMMTKCGIADESKLENAEKWYFKDMRSNPIDLGSTSDICGEYSSDEDEEISNSDLSYLAKSERKGFLLKRSNSDFNLWRRWYCVLMDQLWCVDTSKESTRAKCVRLSGMIRYREGQKTLDQLQIIIINSSDGRSHFFRAFNLIDQKKWLQDLNIKTRIAADNDTFAMAEMIITDEVDARCFRLVKQAGEVLDQPKAMEAIAFHRAVELSTAPTPAKLGAGTSTEGSSVPPTPVPQPATTGALESPGVFVPISRANSLMRVEGAPQPNSQFMLSTTRPNSTRLAGSGAATEANGAEGAEAEPAPVSAAVSGRNVSLTECTRLTHPRNCSCVDLHLLSICDRVEGHHLVHELHRDSRAVTDILLFVLDVQRYRETLRVDLMVSAQKKQQTAVDVYLRHIVPQLRYADLDAYPDFENEMVQLGGGVPVSSASAKFTSPSSPSRLATLSSKAAASTSTSGKHSARNEYSSRVRNRSASTKDPGAVASPPRTASTDVGTSAFTAVNWHVEVQPLMRIHSVLFDIYTRSVEAQNGLVTQDPMQLLKFSAGASKFRSKDRSLSTASTAPSSGTSTSQPATTSYWPWFGFSSQGSNPGSSANSVNTSPVPSRKGSDAAARAAAATPSTAAPVIANGSSTTAGTAAEASKPEPGDASSTNSATIAGIAAVGAEQEGNGFSLTNPDGVSDVDSAPLAGVKSPINPQSTAGAAAGAVSMSGDGEKPRAPPVDLFDEVVALLIQKLA